MNGAGTNGVGVIRLTVALGLAGLLPFADGMTVRPPKERDLAKTLLDRVVARTGVQDGALAVVPLVIVDGANATKVPAGAPMEWAPEGKDRKTEFVSVSRREGKSPTHLPGGMLLGGGVRERMLSRPLLVGEEPAIAAARFADRREEPREKPGVRKVGRLAPLLQRKLDLLLAEDEVLGDLLHVQSHYAGMKPEKKRVEDLFAAPGIAARVAKLRSATGGIPPSYGGGACGYVAFFGGRAVEVVLYASPEPFGRLGPGYLHALAVSAAIWEKATGWLPGGESPKAHEYVAAAKAVLGRVRESRIRRIRPSGKEKRGGDLYRIRPKGAGDEAAGKGVYAGRILVSAAGWPLSLEAFEYGGNLIFPSPLTKPGGRPVDDRPDVKEGAMTLAFLQRLAARRGALRAALFGR